MALPVITNVYRVTFNWKHATAPSAHNVLHFKTTGAVAHLGASINAGVAGLASPSHLWWPMAPGFTCSDIDILPLNGAAGTTNYALSTPLTAGSSGQSMPQVAGIVTLPTGLGGPANRGRIYMGPAGEDAQAGGILASGGKTVMVTAWASFIATLGARSPSVNVGVASYTHGTFNFVTAVRVNDYMATQRRRIKYLQ